MGINKQPETVKYKISYLALKKKVENIGNMWLEKWGGNYPENFRWLLASFIEANTVTWMNEYIVRYQCIVATAAKSLQSCPTLCDPIYGSLPSSPVPGILQARTQVDCHFHLQCRKVKVKLLSRVQLLATPWTAAYQAPPSMGFSRQEYWSGVPLPSPINALITVFISCQREVVGILLFSFQIHIWSVCPGFLNLDTTDILYTSCCRGLSCAV